MAKFGDSGELLKCSFCSKSQKQVKKLIAGPGVYICDECIELCNEIICFGADEREVLLLQHASVLEHCFRQSGTLESWQNAIACYATGNSRLVLAISAAFAGPLSGLARQRAAASISRDHPP